MHLFGVERLFNLYTIQKCSLEHLSPLLFLTISQLVRPMIVTVCKAISVIPTMLSDKVCSCVPVSLEMIQLFWFVFGEMVRESSDLLSSTVDHVSRHTHRIYAKWIRYKSHFSSISHAYIFIKYEINESYFDTDRIKIKWNSTEICPDEQDHDRYDRFNIVSYVQHNLVYAWSVLLCVEFSDGKRQEVSQNQLNNVSIDTCVCAFCVVKIKQE